MCRLGLLMLSLCVYRLQVALKQQFAELKERLLAGMMSVGVASYEEGESGDMETMLDEMRNVEEVDGLERTMKVMYRCIKQLCKARILKNPAQHEDEVMFEGA